MPERASMARVGAARRGPTPLPTLRAGELRLALLGSPVVRVGTRTVSFRTRKECALLVYLALSGTLQPREHLAALLWPDAPDARARDLLRQTLRQLRRHLGAEDDASGDASHRLRAERDRLGRAALGLARGGSPPLAVDTDVLERASAAARRPENAEDLERLLEQAAAAWRGPFLDGVRFDDAPELEAWIGMQRVDAERQVGAVLDRLAGLQMARGAALDAADTARRWLAIDPFDEQAHRRLIRALAASDGPAAALAAYEECRRRLRAGLDVEPSPETTALGARLRRLGDGAPRPPTRARPPTAPAAPAAALDLPLVGRGPPFEQLVASYERARAGETHLVVVEGEAGIGKTRLVDEFLRWAVLEGADVLRGAGVESERRPAYQPLVDALRPRLARERAPDDLVADVWLGELTRLFPELCERYPDLPPPSRLADHAGEGPSRLYEAVAQLALALAGRARPAALVTFVDDAQWADPHTLGLLGYLLQRQRAERCPHLVVLAVRPEALAAAPDRDVQLAAVTRQAATTRVALGPIEREATARALEALLGASPASRGARAWLDFVQAQAGGRPFLVVELLRALAAQGLLARRAPPPQPPVPTRVAEAARRRLAGLSSRARGLALAAAVLGAGAFELLRQTAGLPEDDALAALDELLRSGLVHPADPGGYRLEPDLLRAAVAAEASAAHREILGRRARALLEAASPARTELGTGEEPGPARPRPTDERAGRAA